MLNINDQEVVAAHAAGSYVIDYNRTQNGRSLSIEGTPGNGFTCVNSLNKYIPFPVFVNYPGGQRWGDVIVTMDESEVVGVFLR